MLLHEVSIKKVYKPLQRWNVERKIQSKAEYSMEHNDSHSVASAKRIMG